MFRETPAFAPAVAKDVAWRRTRIDYRLVTPDLAPLVRVYVPAALPRRKTYFTIRRCTVAVAAGVP